MTDDSERKYGRNRSDWRKVYSYSRRKPNIIETLDLTTSQSFSYDLQRIIRSRDYYVINRAAELDISTSIYMGEYDEGLVSFVDAFSATANFNFVFSGNPDAVVLTMETSGSNNNINFFGTTFSTSSITLGLSAPFTGQIRYRAVYSAAGYPVQVTSSFAPASGTFTLAAGYATNLTTPVFSASFGTLIDGPPSLFYRTFWDLNSAFSFNDVDTVVDSTTLNTANGRMSAPMTNSNRLYFIAVQ